MFFPDQPHHLRPHRSSKKNQVDASGRLSLRSSTHSTTSESSTSPPLWCISSLSSTASSSCSSLGGIKEDEVTNTTIMSDSRSTTPPRKRQPMASASPFHPPMPDSNTTTASLLSSAALPRPRRRLSNASSDGDDVLSFGYNTNNDSEEMTDMVDYLNYQPAKSTKQALMRHRRRMSNPDAAYSSVGQGSGRRRVTMGSFVQHHQAPQIITYTAADGTVKARFASQAPTDDVSQDQKQQQQEEQPPKYEAAPKPSPTPKGYTPRVLKQRERMSSPLRRLREASSRQRGALRQDGNRNKNRIRVNA